MSNWTRKIRSGLTPLYIAKHGDDVTGDGSEGNPYQTLSILRNVNFPTLQSRHVIIGDGVYKNESTDLLNPENVIIEGDGNVVLENAVDPQVFRVSGSNAELRNVKIQNSVVGILSTTNRGFDSLNSVVISNCSQSFRFEQEQHIAVKISNCLFVGIGAGSAQQSRLRFDNQNLFASFLNNTMVNDRLLIYNRDNENATCVVANSVFDSCEIETDKKTSGTLIFRNCNFHNSSFVIEGVSYADYSTAVAAVPQFFENCISQDPLFTDAAAGDYTLQSGSPNLANSSDGTQIGCYGEGHTVRVDGAGVTTSNLTVTNGEADLTSAGTGTFESGDVDMGADRVMGIPRVLGDENYGSDEVVDSDLTRLLPNQRTVEMKLVTDADITAAGNDLATALSLKPWETFLIGVKIERDSAGRANGAASYDRDSPVPVVARGYRLRATLRDNGVKS